MVREYRIDDDSHSMYSMPWGVYVVLTDKRYGAQSTKIAEFGKEDDAQLFIDARKKLEASAE